MKKSKLLDAVIDMAHDLQLEKITIREIEALALDEPEPMAARQIKQLRTKANISQAVMAKILNVRPSTYQKWERGEVTPKGANLKLLSLAKNHGVNYILG